MEETLEGTPTAYVATGTDGIALVDASQFDVPILLGGLALPGTTHDIGVDNALGIAALAAGGAGLHLVDVTNSIAPVLLQTVDLGSSAQRVEVYDGLAYVAVGSSLISVDLLTGEVLQTLSLIGGSLTDVARDGTMLFTMTSTDVPTAVDISAFLMVVRDSLTLPNGGGRLFVGGGIAYVAAQNGAQGGYVTADVSDPDNLILISGVDVPAANIVPKTAIVANGSGLGILIGTSTGANNVDLKNLSDPANTNAFVTRFQLPAAPLSAFLTSGIAFIADGAAGLQAINYLLFDTQGVAPTISLSSVTPDLDPTSPGVQVTEGSSLPLRVDVFDDVQVAKVGLLVNGAVTGSDIFFPFSLATIALSNDPADPTVTVQTRATDTGGNSTWSNTITFDLVPDTFGPVIDSIIPADGEEIFLSTRTVRINFSEPLDVATVTASNFILRNALGPVIPLLDIGVRNGDRTVQLAFAPLPIGNYEVVISGAGVTDRVGNPLGADVISTFSRGGATISWIGGSGF